MRLNLWLIGLSFLGSCHAQSTSAADQPQPQRPVECRFAAGTIVIDGEANEADWKQAQLSNKFIIVGQQEKSRVATRARLLWDRDNFYFFAEMDDANLHVDAKQAESTTKNADAFTVFLKPAVEKAGYYEFQVNAAGTPLGVFLPQRDREKYQQFIADSQFRLKTAVKLRGSLNQPNDKDKGWSVEGSVPWSDLIRTGGRPVVNEVWRFALGRSNASADVEQLELSTSASLTRADMHHHEDYAALKFIGPQPDPRLPVGIKSRVPLTTSKVTGFPDPPLPYKPTRAFPAMKLEFPMSLDRVPGSNDLLIVCQGKAKQGCSIFRIPDDPTVEEPTSLFEASSGGIIYGIAFHPKFAENNYLYLGWNGRMADDKSPKRTIVTRYTWNRETRTIDNASALHIISWESDGHNGGDLEFGLDGMLYVTSGDGTSDSDTNLRGQELTHLTAKLLRIDVDHPTDDRPYSIPKDNPFVSEAGIAPETWAYGFRNPWRMTVDPKTGHIWVGNNGQDLWEQVYFVRKGDNYGWSVYEGGHPFYLERKLGPHPHVLPAADHPHSESRSLTGGVVYYGKKLPELVGAYIYGDHSTGRIWGIRHDGKQVTWNKLLADTNFNITGFGLDSHGELLVADHRGNGEGAFYYLEPTPPMATPSTFPRKLSESGLFTDVTTHQMQPGVLPYSVNSPLWSDGAHKERFLAIPHKEGVETKLDFTDSARSWKFPDDTVLIKSFALETVAGDPTSRRWIETRFLTRQEGEWYGYSYLWNNEQTDAELVAAEGLDREYEIRTPAAGDTPEKVTRQTWHFPSRVECMICHSRAANFVLGLSGMQLNREHDYGGVRENQLVVLERLELLKHNPRTDRQRFLKEDLEQIDPETAAAKLAKLRQLNNQRGVPNEDALLGGSPHRYKKLPDPYDDRAPLEDRVRSYLHVNCASCHVEAGGGNAQLELGYQTPLAKTKLIDEIPRHHKFGIEDPRIIAPGDPARSILLHRLSHRGPNSGQMPQLGTNLVDERAVKLFQEWIKTVKPLPEPEKKVEEVKK